jgi:PAS domain S-box-containing protein
LLQWAILVFVVAFVGLGWLMLRRPEATTTTFWALGWISAGGGLLLTALASSFGWIHLAGYPLGTLFVALLLGGALILAERPVPGWLFPVALLVGGVRTALAAAGDPEAAYAVTTAIGPIAVLAAASFARQATRGPDISWAERMLAPACVALATGLGVHGVSLMLSGGTIPPGLLAFWILIGPPILGIQIQAGSERNARVMRHARDELEVHVRERTSELAHANESLRQEIAEREAAERALRASEERYRTVSELSSDFSFTFRIAADLSLELEWVTGAFQRITGYPPEKLQGHGWMELLDEDSHEGILSEFQTARGNGHPVTLDRPIRHRSGEPRWLEIRLDTLESAEDGSLQVVGAARDVSEARRAQDERRRLELHVLEAQKLESLGVLSGGIAHDFNNLLAVILGNARLLVSELPPDSQGRAYLDRIQGAGDHAASLAEQMLVYSGKASLELKPTDVASTVSGVLTLLRASVSEKGQLETRLSPSPLPVEGDASQLRQVALNLVLNASEALEDRAGTIWLRTGSLQADAEALKDCLGSVDPAPGRYVYLEVEDDGAGMNAETQRRIFEPFYTTKFSGRGLGLPAVLGIVRAHRGVVSVSSGPGRGTRIRVLIPLAEQAVLHETEPTRATRTDDTGGLILVVDDEEWVLEVTREFLVRAGYEVLCASGGREGIERFQEQPNAIDAVVLDVAMPDVDGERVLQEMRQVRPDVPVILTTGYGPEVTARRFATEGVTACLRKPFQPEEITQALREALASSS